MLAALGMHMGIHMCSFVEDVTKTASVKKDPDTKRIYSSKRSFFVAYFASDSNTVIPLA
jgi:hypothetical protein